MVSWWDEKLFQNCYFNKIINFNKKWGFMRFLIGIDLCRFWVAFFVRSDLRDLSDSSGRSKSNGVEIEGKNRGNIPL